MKGIAGNTQVKGRRSSITEAIGGKANSRLKQGKGKFIFVVTCNSCLDKQPFKWAAL